jgi:hypothetical protein
VRVVVVDKRPLAAANGSVLRYGHSGPYRLAVTLTEVSIWDLNMGASPVIGGSHTMEAPGAFVFTLPAPHAQTTATVRVSLVDARGVRAVDEFALSFHMRYHKLLKWLLALPLAASVAAAMAALAKTEHGGLGLPN